MFLSLSLSTSQPEMCIALLCPFDIAMASENRVTAQMQRSCHDNFRAANYFIKHSCINQSYLIGGRKGEGKRRGSQDGIPKSAWGDTPVSIYAHAPLYIVFHACQLENFARTYLPRQDRWFFEVTLTRTSTYRGRSLPYQVPRGRLQDITLWTS